MGAFLVGRAGLGRAAALHRRCATTARRKTQAPVVLVGKGITFDTGGISLKPGAEMDEMKFDMCGAASVLGTLARRRRAEAEASTWSASSRPARTCPSGTRDQAGRRRHQHVGPDDRDPQHRRRRPADPVRRADLRRALQAGGRGRHRDADRRLRDRARPSQPRPVHAPTTRSPAQLLAAGRGALDPCWRMPLDDEYDEALKSNFADMANIGGRAGGAITAAMFLQRFTAQVPVGPPRHRRHGLEVGRAEGRDRPPGRAAHPLRPRPRQVTSRLPGGMTEISFYFNVPSRTGYACRLLRRAQRQGMALTVTGPAEALRRDRSRARGASPRRSSLPTAGSSARGDSRSACMRRRSGSAQNPIDAPLHERAAEPRRAHAACASRPSSASWRSSRSTSATARRRASGWKAYARRGYPIQRHEVAA